MDPHDHNRALSADLAALVSVSGRLFTLIRARCWDAQGDPTRAGASIEDILSWSDAAHNLSMLGAGLLTSGKEGVMSPETFQRTLKGLVRSLEATAERAERSSLIETTLRDAAQIVNRVADHARIGATQAGSGSVRLINAHDRDVGSRLLLDGEEIGRADYDNHGSAGLELLEGLARNIARVTGLPLEMEEVADDAFDHEP